MFSLFKQNGSQRIIRLSDTTCVDLNQISAVYIKSGALVIRIGGMGVVELTKGQLDMGVEAAAKHLVNLLKN